MSHIARFFTFFTGAVLLSTFLFVFSLFDLFGGLPNIRPEFYIFAFASSLSFILGFLLIYVYPSSFARRVYQYGAYWIGAFSLGVVLFVIFLFVSYIFHLDYTGKLSLFLFILLILLLNAYGLYLSFVTKITKYKISLPGAKSWKGKKIVLISDTHYGNIYGRKSAAYLVKKINDIQPEIVLMAGDFFDGPKIDFDEITSEFTKLTAPKGMLYANGNHEEYGDIESMYAAMHKAGFIFINNEYKTIDGINFIGVSYTESKKQEDFEKILADMKYDETMPNILVKHKPSFHDSMKKFGINLAVSGHTHKGQIFPLSLIAKYVYGKYVYGMVQEGNFTSITSCGVGNWGPPQSLGTFSEIVVIEIV